MFCTSSYKANAVKLELHCQTEHEHTPAPCHYSSSVWTDGVRDGSPAGSRTAVGKMQRTDAHVRRKLLWLQRGKGHHVVHLTNSCIYVNVICMCLAWPVCLDWIASHGTGRWVFCAADAYPVERISRVQPSHTPEYVPAIGSRRVLESFFFFFYLR